MNPSAELKERILALAPWHLDVAVGDFTTRVALEANDDSVAFIDGRPNFVETIRRIYPNGFEGRSFLDCACNCGGYSFWAREMGAGEVFGFDVREHWIQQARFLAEERQEELRFEQLNLYDLPELNLEPFDVTLFKGILYHLRDPMQGLAIAAERTKELLIVDTATRNGFPDGALVATEESTTHPMSGVQGLAWFPTGPEVLRQMLAAVGFPEVRVNLWSTHSPSQPPELGRLEVLSSRTPETFRVFDSHPSTLH